MPSLQAIVLLVALVVLLFIGVKWIFLWRRVQTLGQTPPPPGWSAGSVEPSETSPDPSATDEGTPPSEEITPPSNGPQIEKAHN